MHAEHSPSRYWVVWAALAALTVATFLLARVDLGAWHLPLAMAIASGKSALVVLFFMHLAEHRGTSAVVFATSLVFVAVLILFVLLDVQTRFPLVRPPGPAPLGWPR